MKILLFGKNGQLGWELQRSLAPLGSIMALGTDDILPSDFTRPDDVAMTARKFAPDLIVNAAAYTAVDKAESDQDAAHLVNAVTPGLLAEVAAELDAWLVHYSTDYVFDGTGQTPWRETDPTQPLNVYGRSKLLGEKLVRATNCKHLIFRTSWVYAARGKNFAKTMLKLAVERDILKVINDQHGAPTGADLLADITAHVTRSVMQNRDLAGTYHVAPRGETTWHEYAEHVIRFGRAAGFPIKVQDINILPVSSSEFASPAFRPANSRLDTSKLRHTFGLHLPHWQAGVDRMLAEVLENQRYKL